MFKIKKKLIYVGSLGKSPDRDWIWIKQFSDLGWKVIPFSSRVNFKKDNILNKLKRRLSFGNEYLKMQQELLSLCLKEKPSWIHFRLPIEFDRQTLEKIREKVPLITQYFNDNPFSKKSPKGLYLKFKKNISLFDIHFVYRSENIKEYKKLGAKEVYHLAPMYVSSSKYKIKKKNSDNFIADAAFIGHWENDNRIEMLSHVMNSNLSLIVKGGMWDKAVKGTSLQKLIPIKPAFNKEYKKIYANVIAGICFFSKINHDNFNRRALEIIEMGGVLVCEKTNEAMSYFKDKKEALFFDTKNQLVKQIKMLKHNPDIRKKIQKEGKKKLLKGKFSIKHRAHFINNLISIKLSKYPNRVKKYN